MDGKIIDSGIVRTFEIKGYKINISGVGIRRFIYSYTEFSLASWLILVVMTGAGDLVPIHIQLTALVWFFFKPYYLLGSINNLFTFKKIKNRVEPRI